MAGTSAALKIDTRPLSELKAAPYNPRVISDAAMAGLTESVRRFGLVQPIVVNERTGYVVGGHQRIKALAELGHAEAQVIVGNWSEEEERQLNLTLNNPHVAGDWSDGLKDVLKSLQNTEALAVLRLDALAELSLPANTEVDAEPQIDRAEELRKEWGVEVGQLWELGGHRLLCGDCTKQEDVDRVMGGGRAELMVTDPPYGVNLDQSWRDKALGDKAMGPGNRNVVPNDDRSDWSDAWKLFPGDVVYVWHASKVSDVVMTSLRSASFEICQQLIWNKSVMVMGRSDYHFKHEPCWYAVRRGRPHRWIGDRKQTTVIEAKSPNHIMSGSTEEKTAHPTQKPVECMSSLIRNHSGDVYEPFNGSGTTIIACEQLGRKCCAIEIDPGYVAVALQRFKDATGRSPTLVDGRDHARAASERIQSAVASADDPRVQSA